MPNPEAVYISAYIPNIDGTKYVVAQHNQPDTPDVPSEGYPTRVFESSKDQTYEGTLGSIAVDVTGTQGKIDKRLTEKEESLNHITYLMKPIADTAIDSTRYGWHSRLD